MKIWHSGTCTAGSAPTCTGTLDTPLTVPVGTQFTVQAVATIDSNTANGQQWLFVWQDAVLDPGTPAPSTASNLDIDHTSCNAPFEPAGLTVGTEGTAGGCAAGATQAPGQPIASINLVCATDGTTRVALAGLDLDENFGTTLDIFLTTTTVLEDEFSNVDGFGGTAGTPANVASITVTCGTGGAPADTPTPTNTTGPTATNTPIPTATNTVEPTATNTAGPTATNTVEPTATNTVEPTATNTPGGATETATATNTAVATATATTTAVATATATASPAGTVQAPADTNEGPDLRTPTVAATTTPPDDGAPSPAPPAATATRAGGGAGAGGVAPPDTGSGPGSGSPAGAMLIMLLLAAGLITSGLGVTLRRHRA
jgi:hypothetical protein